VLGHYELLHWLWEQGCPRDLAQIGATAAQGGNVQILQYLVEQGIEVSQPMLNGMLLCFGVKGKLETAQWLREHGAEWPKVLQAAGDVWPDAAVA
jgi:hypothetical protein